MRLMRVCLMVGYTLGLAGCYDFHSPLDATPQVAVDQALLGEWVCIPTNPDPYPAENLGAFVFVATGERTYLIQIPGEPPDTKDDGAVYGSILDGATLLNLPNDDPESGRTWTLVRYSFLLPNVLRLELVKDSYGGWAESPAALREALQQPGARSGAYEDFLVCTHVQERK
jgi:hypothetical protein